MSISKLANIVGNFRYGENCRVDPFVTITGNVVIGNNVHIGVGACIFGTYGVKIGNKVSVSPGAKIFTSTEDPDSDLPSNPTLEKRYSINGDVVVEDCAVIGSNSIVLPSTRIGKNTQIGALSLVKGVLDENSVYAGIPVKKLRKRHGNSK